MKAIASAALALSILLSPLDCKAPEGGSGGRNVEVQGEGSAGKLQGSYVLHLNALDKRAERARRTVECTVTALRGNTIVTIVDPQTGAEVPYVMHIRDLRIPNTVTIRDYVQVEFITVNCVMRGEPGDSLHLEVTSGDRMAPQRAIQDLDIIPDGGIRATVFTTIVANA